MSLFHFGTSDRRLLGIFEPSALSSSRGVVLCNPWGKEYLLAHQSLRVLAQLIARGGRHVLRFDWYGSGDSGGDSLEGGHPDSWLEDLRLAIEELRAMAQVTSVALVGLRLGASVAAHAASERTDIDRLVLWDPIIDGRAYLRELSDPVGVLQPAAWRELAETGADPTYSVRGFPLTADMRAGIATVRVEDFGRSLPPTLLVSTVEDPQRYEPLRQRLRESGTSFTDEVTRGPLVWVEVEEFGAAGMPVGALRAIAEWLS